MDHTGIALTRLDFVEVTPVSGNDACQAGHKFRSLPDTAKLDLLRHGIAPLAMEGLG